MEPDGGSVGPVPVKGQPYRPSRASDRKSRSLRQHLGTENVPREIQYFVLDFLCPVSDTELITARSVAFICDENAGALPPHSNREQRHAAAATPFQTNTFP